MTPSQENKVIRELIEEVQKNDHLRLNSEKEVENFRLFKSVLFERIDENLKWTDYKEDYEMYQKVYEKLAMYESHDRLDTVNADIENLVKRIINGDKHSVSARVEAMEELDRLILNAVKEIEKNDDK